METIVIIGAGASGLACMNELVKTNKYNIIVLEQSNKAARKILASGNGRCNVSNLNMDIKYYNHQDPLIEKLIKEFDVVNFFKQLSLKLRYEKNLVYPYSLSSLSVKNALMKNMDNVSYIDNCEALAIKKAKTYEIVTTNGHYQADKIVIATGSPASHLSGQNNLKMLEKMHISMIPFTPSLVQVKTKPVFKALKGQRVKGIAMLYDQNQLIEKQTGEIMFTDYGLSGICIMQLSRYLDRLKNPKLVLNLLPDIEKEEFQHYGLEGFFHEKIVQIFKEKNIDPRCLEFKIIDTMSIEKAQVCHGGVSLKEVDENLQLKKYPGIYVCGEALDVDGDCGGYNLHFAFASGDSPFSPGSNVSISGSSKGSSLSGIGTQPHLSQCTSGIGSPQ